MAKKPTAQQRERYMEFQKNRPERGHLGTYDRAQNQIENGVPGSERALGGFVDTMNSVAMKRANVEKYTGPGTKQSQRAGEKAAAAKLGGHQAMAVTAVSGGAAVLSALSLNPLGVMAGTGAALVGAQVAENKYAESRATKAKGRAVDGAIQRARGGSTALGMRGVSADQMAGFVSKNKDYGAKQDARAKAPSAGRERAGEMVEVTNANGTTFQRRNPHYGKGRTE